MPMSATPDGSGTISELASSTNGAVRAATPPGPSGSYSP
jgi:hypothetical protein